MHTNNEPLGYAYSIRDLLIALLVVFMALSVFALVSHPKQKPGVQAGSLIFQMHWQDSSDSDIDLWMKPPDDRPIGYSHMSGHYCNLLRDDLGRDHDPASTNTEVNICRKALPGEYIVNTMAYNAYDGNYPISVTVTVTELSTTVSRMLIEKTVQLQYQGQELTVFRFTLDKQGNIVPGSINDLQIPLRADGEG